MKKFLNIILGLLLSASAVFADNTVTVLTANTAANIYAANRIIDEIAVTATSANVTTVNFYDSATSATNYTRTAYTGYTSYATNFTTIFTNESGVLVTNSFSGVYTAPVAVAGGATVLPKLQTIIVPGSALRVKAVQLQTIRGLTAMADQNCIVEVTYRNNP